MAEVNRLKQSVISGISEWLDERQLSYDFYKFCILLDQISAKITLDMDEDELNDTIQEVISEWRNALESKLALFVRFDDWYELSETVRDKLFDELLAEISDQVVAKASQVKRDEGLCHAS